MHFSPIHYKSFFNNYIITFGISCSELYDCRSVKGKSLDNDHLLHSTTCPFLRCDCYNSVVWRSAKKACNHRCVGTSYWRDWSILYPVRYRKGYIGIKKPVERPSCMNIHSWNNPFLACSWFQKLETYKFPDFDKITFLIQFVVCETFCYVDVNICSIALSHSSSMILKVVNVFRTK